MGGTGGTKKKKNPNIDQKENKLWGPWGKTNQDYHQIRPEKLVWIHFESCKIGDCTHKSGKRDSLSGSYYNKSTHFRHSSYSTDHWKSYNSK